MPTTVGDWAAALDALYNPAWAEDWDVVGLASGDVEAICEQALFAVDPAGAVFDEADALGCQLIVTHHPLLLAGIHAVTEGDARGRAVARLVRAGTALFVAHTNADVADPGVSDALAARIGLRDTVPLAPAPPDDGFKLVTFVPAAAADTVVDALADAGAGRIGGYTRCAWTSDGIGTFVAGESTNPTVGRRGDRTDVDERRVEMVVSGDALGAVLTALGQAHPYEEPAYDVYPTVVANSRGLGRVGELAEPTALAELAAVVSAALPRTAVGLRVAGDLRRMVQRVAVCGGSGSELVDAAKASGAEVFITADLRHHRVADAVADGLALIDAGHWATEAPWLDHAAQRVSQRLAVAGHTVEVHVSATVTDPWSALVHAKGT